MPKMQIGTHLLALVMICLASFGARPSVAACPSQTGVSHSFNFIEGAYYLVSAPACPDTTGTPVITDALTLETAIKNQYGAQGRNVASFQLGVLRVFDGGVLQGGGAECYRPGFFPPRFEPVGFVRARSERDVVDSGA